MSLLQTITEFFESIFKRSSPEVLKKQAVRKMESEIKLFTPQLMKGSLVLPNLGEAIHSLYVNCRILDDLFKLTVGNNDLQRKHRFESQLVLTGYNPSDQDLIETLSYEARKAAVMAEAGDSKAEARVYAAQRKSHEHLIKVLNDESFKNMDKEILQLRQLVDFCGTNFLPVLQIFDGNFIPGDMGYQPTYSEIPVDRLINVLEDLYYQSYGLRITNATANAVVALAQMRVCGNLSAQKAETYVTALKRIAYVLTRVLTTDKLKVIIRYAKGDENYEPRVVSYSGSPKQEFANLMTEHFVADEKRIKSELQDEQIERELSSLFSGTNLLGTGAYNPDNNAILMANSPLSFKHILPLRILKTFVQIYLPDSVRTLLNDLVIEGFFTNPNYKQSFSENVYACLGIDEVIQMFESSFGNDQPNSIAVLQSYIKDSHKDRDFYKKLESMVLHINDEAKSIIQSETTHLYALYKMIGELLSDSKKPSGEIIENLKVTLMSSRHRENTSFLEKTYGTWKTFFDIMKNYAIINMVS